MRGWMAGTALTQQAVPRGLGSKNCFDPVGIALAAVQIGSISLVVCANLAAVFSGISI